MSNRQILAINILKGILKDGMDDFQTTKNTYNNHIFAVFKGWFQATQKAGFQGFKEFFFKEVEKDELFLWVLHNEGYNDRIELIVTYIKKLTS